MTKQIAIRAQNIGKSYHIGDSRRAGYKTFRESIVDTLQQPLRRARSLLSGQSSGAADLHETIWALEDISFEVEPGEVVGIIGRNGAGKSTLLKILSRITHPSRGTADIYGRVGSLLEVGTGFHPELTGRENVYLNGAILGMTRREIESKFDEIIDFSGVEQFMETPVKHYSSGMRLRLAFAVAAHLEPEILIIDEVLAVGDAAFQRKCLNKMQSVSEHGRTILFVSHNMSAITRLCERTILLNKGRILQDGPSHAVIGAYLNSGMGSQAVRTWPDPTQAPGDETIRMRAVRVQTEEGEISDALDIRHPVILEVEYDLLQPDHVWMFYFTLRNDEGQVIFCTIDSDATWRNVPRPAGHYTSRVRIPGNLLAEGTVFVTIAARTIDPTILRVSVNEAVAFQVIDRMEGDSARVDHAGDLGGIVRPLLDWSTEFHQNGHAAKHNGVLAQVAH
jgi:lipopolysaccharide transport system ATP-binding protein